MKRKRFVRLFLSLLGGVALFSAVALALAPAPVAAEDDPPSYTGDLEFTGDFDYNPDALQGEITVNKLGPFKVGVHWTCEDQGGCKNTGPNRWTLEGGEPVASIKVCLSGQWPDHLFSDCDEPDSIGLTRCKYMPEGGACSDTAGGSGAAPEWDTEYGAYCYDLAANGFFPWRLEIDYNIKQCNGPDTTYYLTIVEVDGETTGETISECVEVENVILTGPPTATTGVAATYELSWWTETPVEVDIEIGVDEGGIATGPVWGEQDNYYREFFINWLIQGVHTVTARVETPCSYGEASVTTEITHGAPFTNVIPLLPIGECDVEDPDSACYFNCADDLPLANYGWDFGAWIEYLKDWIVCTLMWLGRVIRWVGLSIVNALISVFNTILTWDGLNLSDIIRWIEWQEFTWSNFVENSFANLGNFLKEHILAARNWMYDALTWAADNFEIGGDLLGNNIESLFTEVGDWTATNLEKIGQTANESITNWGAARAADIDHFRDWSYEGLMKLANYFSSWGTGFGDFLATCVTVFADFLYWILTQISTFVRNFTDALGNMVEGAMIKLGQFLYILLVSIGKLLNAFFTKTGLFIANLIRMVRDTLYFWMTVLAYAVDAFFTGLGKFLGLVIRGVAEFAKLCVLAFNALMAGLSMAAQLALVLAQTVVDAILKVYAAVIWFSQLVIELLDALVSGLQSDSTPEMYTGAEGLYYFWEGLSFFETISESSPLSTLNTIAIAFIGINLLFWTFRQIADTISDLLHFA